MCGRGCTYVHTDHCVIRRLQPAGLRLAGGCALAAIEVLTGMTIIIDPTLGLDDLAVAADYCATMPKEMVWVCLAPDHARYLSERIGGRVRMLGEDWSVRERVATSWVYRNFHEIALSSEATVRPWPAEFPYDIAVPVVFLAYAAHEGLVYWFVLLLLERYASELARTAPVTMIGASPHFFAAVEAVVGLRRRSLFRRLVISSRATTSVWTRYTANARKYRHTIRACRRATVGQKSLYVEPFPQNMEVLRALAEHTGLGYFTTPFAVGRKLMFDLVLRGIYSDAAHRLSSRMMNLLRGSPPNGFPSSLNWDSAVAGFVHAAGWRLRRDLAIGYWTWRMLDEKKPAAALCYTWFGVHRHFVRRWCSAGNGTFIVMQHGFGAGGVVGLAEGVVDADLFLTWGVGNNEAFVDAWDGNRTAVMLAVGNPLYGTADTDAAIPQDLELRRVLVAPSAFGIQTRDLQEWFWDEIEMAVKDHPMLRWTLRIHPRDSQRDELLRRFQQADLTVSAEARIMDAIAKNDLVVTTSSTVALDTMAAGRPVVVINHPDWPERLSAWDAGILVRQYGELSKVIAEFRSGTIDIAQVLKPQDRFRQHFGRPWDVDATMAVLEKAISR